MRDRDCVAFLQWALPRLGMRWPGFRKVRRQVCRRIARRLGEIGLADLAAYRRRLAAEPAEWRVLDSLCRVTISRFFRDRGVFASLGERVLPALAARSAAGPAELAAWSAGCASGEEPYSVAILWHRAVAPDRPAASLRVIATDTDPVLLERARRAVYPAGSLREVPAPWRRRAFEQRGESFHLLSELAAAVDFRRQDLRRTNPGGPFDLVLCRNLAFTYYADDVQRAVLERIGSVLSPGGALVVGGHEEPPAAAAGFEPWPGAACCYRRRSGGA